MPDLEDRFRSLGRISSPDLWTEIEGREPSRTPPGPSAGRRWLAGAVALAVAAAGFAFAASVFRSGEQPRPVSAVANGRIAFSGSDGGSRQIYSTEPDGTDLAKLTDLPTNQFHPAWS